MTEPLARKSRHCFFFGVVTDELIQKMKETKQKKNEAAEKGNSFNHRRRRRCCRNKFNSDRKRAHATTRFSFEIGRQRR